MDWEKKLLAVPTEQWVVDQVVVLDWYDGPRQGFCALANPAVEFFFELIDEAYNPDGLDRRIFKLRELAPHSILAVVAELERLGAGRAVKPIWVPIWKFSSKDGQDQARRMIELMQSRARPTELLVASADLKHFSSCGYAVAPTPEKVA